MSWRLRKQPFKKQPERDGKTPWSSIGNNSRRHQEARVAGSSTGEGGRCEQEDEGDLPRGRSKKEEEEEIPREQLEGPVDLGYDPGPREAAIQNKKLRTLWLPRNHKVRRGDRAGMDRYKQCRVAVSPAHVVGERRLPNMLVGGGTSWEGELGNSSNERPSGTPMIRLASEEEISPTIPKSPETGRNVVNCMNHSPFECRGRGEIPTNGVEVGGEVATQWASSGAPTLVEHREFERGGDGLVLGLSVTSSPGRMMTTNDRVPVAKMGLAKPRGVPKSAGLGRKQLGLPGRTGDLACGPGSVDLNQPPSKQRGSQSDLKKREREKERMKKMDPGSLEEKEVHEKKEIEAVNTNAWKKLEVKEEECMSKLVLPQPPRLVKRTRKRKVKLPELLEGQQEIRNFLKAAGGCQPKIPKEMLVPTPTNCEAKIGTRSETKKRKKELVCDVDDELEPSPKRTATQLRRKPSSFTELEEGTGSKTTVSRIARFSDHELEEGTGMCKLEEGTANTSSSPRFSISKTKTTVSRTARFSDHETQSKEGLKSTNMNISEIKK